MESFHKQNSECDFCQGFLFPAFPAPCPSHSITFHTVLKYLQPNGIDQGGGRMKMLPPCSADRSLLDQRAFHQWRDSTGYNPLAGILSTLDGYANVFQPRCESGTFVLKIVLWKVPEMTIGNWAKWTPPRVQNLRARVIF